MSCYYPTLVPGGPLIAPPVYLPTIHPWATFFAQSETNAFLACLDAYLCRSPWDRVYAGKAHSRNPHSLSFGLHITFRSQLFRTLESLHDADLTAALDPDFQMPPKASRIAHPPPATELAPVPTCPASAAAASAAAAADLAPVLPEAPAAAAAAAAPAPAARAKRAAPTLADLEDALAVEDDMSAEEMFAMLESLSPQAMTKLRKRARNGNVCTVCGKHPRGQKGPGIQERIILDRLERLYKRLKAEQGIDSMQL